MEEKDDVRSDVMDLGDIDAGDTGALKAELNAIKSHLDAIQDGLADIKREIDAGKRDVCQTRDDVAKMRTVSEGNGGAARHAFLSAAFLTFSAAGWGLAFLGWGVVAAAGFAWVQEACQPTI